MADAGTFHKVGTNSDGDAVWHVCDAPAHVSVYESADMLEWHAREGVRAYVDGCAVVAGTQALTPGALVLLVDATGETRSLCYGGRRTAITVAGNGRACALTGLPIEGLAVQCARCKRLLAAMASDPPDRCVCGASLADGNVPDPGEELL
jgi:hypothetical protein